MRSVPAQLAATPGAEEAVAFVVDAYGTRLQRPGRTVAHPIAVAGLLASQGHPAPVVMAGLAHDLLEDTDVSADELRGRFGPQVSRLVEALTQDTTIDEYRDRKGRASSADPRRGATGSHDHGGRQARQARDSATATAQASPGPLSSDPRRRRGPLRPQSAQRAAARAARPLVSASDGDGRPAGEPRAVAELLLDAQQLVVLRHALAARRRSRS